jgi:hypothetical protein
MDNLDTEIEKLLNQRQDYNFAIDKQGNKVASSAEAPAPEAVDSKAKQQSLNR